MLASAIRRGLCNRKRVKNFCWESTLFFNFVSSDKSWKLHERRWKQTFSQWASSLTPTQRLRQLFVSNLCIYKLLIVQLQQPAKSSITDSCWSFLLFLERHQDQQTKRASKHSCHGMSIRRSVAWFLLASVSCKSLQTFTLLGSWAFSTIQALGVTDSYKKTSKSSTQTISLLHLCAVIILMCWACVPLTITLYSVTSVSLYACASVIARQVHTRGVRAAEIFKTFVNICNETKRNVHKKEGDKKCGCSYKITEHNNRNKIN